MTALAPDTIPNRTNQLSLGGTAAAASATASVSNIGRMGSNAVDIKGVLSTRRIVLPSAKG